VGSLGWPARETRPDLACTVSMAQKKQGRPTIQDILDTNKAVKQAKLSAKAEFIIPKLDVGAGLCLVVYHDAAWGNAEEGPGVGPPGAKTHSQAGYLVYLCERRILEGKPGRAVLLAWRSHGLRRVTRSTFAAETMSCADALDAAELVRALILETIIRGIDPTDGELLSGSGLLPITGVTDCRSLYDTVHRDSGRLPQERRLLMDLAWIREFLQREAPTDPRESMRLGAMPLRWVPTSHMLADVMTKIMDLRGQTEKLTCGELTIPCINEDAMPPADEAALLEGFVFECERLS